MCCHTHLVFQSRSLDFLNIQDAGGPLDDGPPFHLPRSGRTSVVGTHPCFGASHSQTPTELVGTTPDAASSLALSVSL